MPASGAIIAVRDLAGMLCTVSFGTRLPWAPGFQKALLSQNNVLKLVKSSFVRTPRAIQEFIHQSQLAGAFVRQWGYRYKPEEKLWPS